MYAFIWIFNNPNQLIFNQRGQKKIVVVACIETVLRVFCHLLLLLLLLLFLVDAYYG